MQRLLILLLFTPLHLFAQTSNGNFSYDGLVRDYILYVPSGYNAGTPTPLVINMHGYTSNASQQMLYADFNSDADTAGYIVVYPNGINNAWNSGFNFPYESGVDDVGFLNALIDTIANDYNIDECRIHATGMSNGGYMSYRLACELYDRIASIASVTGSMSVGMTTHCDITRPVAVMQIHGTADPTVPYNGGTGSTSVEENLQYWKNKNSCQGDSVVTNLPDIVSDGTTVTKIYQGNCAESTEVIIFRVNNGGHTWPDAVIDIGTTTKDINANSEIIQFFNKHPRCASTTGIKDMNVAEHTTLVYPNPAANSISISTKLNAPYQIHITDISGKQVMSLHTENLENISIQELNPGFYNITISNSSAKEVIELIKQ